MTKPTRKRSRHNGEGSIRKRANGTWEARYSAGRNMITGRQIRKSLYGKTRNEVLEKLQKALATVASPSSSASTNITLAEYMSVVAQQRTGHVSPRSSELDQDWIRHTNAHETGKIELQHLKVSHLEAFYRDLALTKSKSVVMHTRSFINLCLKQALKYELVTAHVGLTADIPQMVKPKVAQALTVTEVTRLLQTAREYSGGRWYGLVYFAISLGLRHGELLGLQWQDIDFGKQELKIARVVSLDVKSNIRITEPKTAASRRTLYLSDEHFSILADIRAQQQGLGTEWIFCTKQGLPLRRNNVLRQFHVILKKAELPRLRIHDLRHTFATYLIGQGHDVKTVSDLMGHTDSRLTLEIYTHTQEAEKKRAALSASRIVSEATGEL